MSKKKPFSGATMSLKDFHGGSIPSDLPLPSAPGVSMRPPDRPAAWGPPARPRPTGSGGAVAGAAARGGLDDRPPLPFLPRAPAHFDEDERKPFFDSAAASPAPRRPLADPVRAPPPPASRTEPAQSVPSDVGAVPSPWSVPRREESPPMPIYSSGPSMTSRLVQASAMEKVASGRWQSRPPVPVPPDVEVICFDETDGLDRKFGRINGDRGARAVVYLDTKERSLGGSYSLDQERVGTVVKLEPKERDVARFDPDGLHPVSGEKRFDGAHPNRQGQSDVSERPKLKLLPRSKPLESSGTQAFIDKQVYQQPQEPVRVVNAHEIHGNLLKPGSAGADDLFVERPRLNLKPRTQPLEQSNESAEQGRKSVFGGARPRELVLKERGVDPASNGDVSSPVNRGVNHEISKTEPKQMPISPVAQHSERAENFILEQRGARDLERKKHWQNPEKMDVQGSSWRSDHRKNIREIEKPLELQRQEPDTWRKPVEEPKPDATGPGPGPGPRFGKAASALELAQAFSRPVTDNQQGILGRSQVPFSRLTDTRELHAGRPQRQINGY